MRHRTHSQHDHDHGHHHHGRRFARDPLEMGELPGGRNRHPHERHMGSRSRRLFDHGDLRFILLSMLAARPAHGYDLIKALEDRMGGGYSPSPGVIYPTLTMLEEQGYASLTAEDGKKLYRATPEGMIFLQDNQATLDSIQRRIDAIARERSITADPRIIRALENLKLALRLRLANGTMPDEQIQAVAAAIDAAAAAAERT